MRVTRIDTEAETDEIIKVFDKNTEQSWPKNRDPVDNCINAK